MHLKRLEIHGYKSFAARTVIDVDAGITAVVGPNGSGKSNITDALRWVLGEGAGKALRTRRLEDVIFAGSEQRPPAGMAEVRITLNNEDGWLPLDFTEVTVARRVHRDGDSEFWINDNKVRLRDLQDLFLRSGLGPGSYAVMGQGLVEEVLRLRPEERRALIEEVANVRRYRLKMDEARKKREETHENLARVRLVADEIAPRVRTLERQAKRALKYAEGQAEFQRALSDWYGREWRRLGDQLALLRATHDQRRSEQQAAAGTEVDAETALSDCERQLRDARLTADRAETEERRRVDDLRRLEQERAVLQERQRLLTDRAAELRRDLAALDRDDDRTLDEPPAAPPDPAVGEAVTETEAALDAARRRLAAIEAEQETLRGRSAAAQERLSRLDAAGRENDTRLARIATEIEQIEAQASVWEQRRRLLEDARAQADDGVARADESTKAAAAAAAEARRTREDLAQRSYGAAAFLRNLEASRSDRERRLARARDRLQLLRELQAEAEGMKQGLRALFGARGVPRGDEPTGIPGVLGVVRHLLRAPRGLERAIEAALEDYVDAVVFEKTDDALQVIQALLRERAGRIVTLPLESLGRRSPPALQPEPGVLGTAASLVQCNERFRPLIDTILGRTIVTEDIETARKILTRGFGSVVTRDGQLLRPIGAIIGGEVGETGSFTRESELQSLPAEITELERSLKDAGEINVHRAELEQLEHHLADAERDVEAAIDARAQALDEAAVVRADTARLRGDLEANQAEGERAQERREALRLEEAALRAESENRAAEVAALEAERPAVSHLEEADRRRRAQAQLVGEAEARHAVQAGRLETLRAAVRARDAAQSRVREQRRDRSERLAEVEAELSQITATLEQRQRDLEQLRAARDTAVADRTPESEALARVTDLEATRRQDLQAAQRTLLATDRALLSAEAAFQEGEAVRNRLREAMRADGFDADDRGAITALDADANAAAAVAFAPPAAGQAPPPAPAPAGAAAAVAELRLGSNGGAAGEEKEEEQTPLLSDQDLRARVDKLRTSLRRLGNVNPDAAAEFAELRDRYDYLTGQVADLEGAEQRMRDAETELSDLIRGSFRESFTAVDAQFRRYFQTMFRGGKAKLILVDDDWDGGGIEIEAQPPGKRLKTMAMLSGGERSLTAIALLFAMLDVNPAPFCVLDEVDAALDEANVGRFVDALKQLAPRTQFVVITHNRRTIEQADTIYGITMGEDSASRVLSVRLAELNLPD